MLRRVPVAVLLIAAPTTLVGCGDFEWNQKVTITVETPNGVKTGSSVMHVEWKGRIPGVHGDAAGGGTDLTGEATVVDLGSGHYVFGLLKDMNTRILRSLRKKDPSYVSKTPPKTVIFSLTAPVELTPEDYPVLVTFADIHDPESVRRVDPLNLAANFGAGTRLRSITIERTDDLPEIGPIEILLPWLEPIGRERSTLVSRPPRLTKDAVDPEIQYLAPSAFSTELYK